MNESDRSIQAKRKLDDRAWRKFTLKDAPVPWVAPIPVKRVKP